jgi:alpha-beta hydrolase superfamily lysophospholipase
MTAPVRLNGIDGYREETRRHEARDGTLLFHRSFKPYGDAPTGHLDLIHGWADHSGRYLPLLEALRPLNLAICLPDLRGHGHSGGKRGHLNRFEDYLLDLTQVFELTADTPEKHAPRWLLGHSMGGLLAYYLALRFPQHYQGVILSSPFMAFLPPLGFAQRALIRLLSRLIPALPQHKRLASEGGPVGISHDSAVVKAYQEDPLVHATFTPRWLSEILAAQEKAPPAAARLRLPLLMQISPDDTVVDSQAALAIYLRLPAGLKTLRVYPKRGHELYNETPAKRLKPLKDLVSWIGERQEKCLVEAASSGR